MLSLGVSVR